MIGGVFVRVKNRAFSLIELIVVAAVTAGLLAMLLPALNNARSSSKAVLCRANLRAIGQGWNMYADENRDVMAPGRYGRGISGDDTFPVPGGRKYRPRWIALVSAQLGIPPFLKPMADPTAVDPEGEPGDRQNYRSRLFVCPMAASWTDERNAAYGYNYQFLANARATAGRFHNFPVGRGRVRSSAECVVAADSMGTAAHYPAARRRTYDNNGRHEQAMGNEGWPLDPPRVAGETASSSGHRSAVHPRHVTVGVARAAVLYVDGHSDLATSNELGYAILADGSFALDSAQASNRRWSPSGEDELAPARP